MFFICMLPARISKLKWIQFFKMHRAAKVIKLIKRTKTKILLLFLILDRDLPVFNHPAPLFSFFQSIP